MARRSRPGPGDGRPGGTGNLCRPKRSARNALGSPRSAAGVSLYRAVARPGMGRCAADHSEFRYGRAVPHGAFGRLAMSAAALLGLLALLIFGAWFVAVLDGLARARLEGRTAGNVVAA